MTVLKVDWEKTVFVLMGPDAFARHIALPILERVIAMGYKPIAYAPVLTRLPELDAFYEKNIRTAWDAYRFRCVDLLFAFGPMVVMLIQDQVQDREGGSHGALKVAKGDSDPYKAAPGTIRSDFGSVNQTVSMVHFSDSPEDAEYEMKVFMPASGPIWLNENTEELISVFRAFTPHVAETRGFDDVLGGLRLKAAMAAWTEMAQEGRSMVGDWIRAEGVYALSRKEAGERIVEHLPGKTSHLLAPVLTCEFQPDQPKQDVERISHLLTAYGVSLDKWEELLLTTSMFFKPRRREDLAT